MRWVLLPGSYRITRHTDLPFACPLVNGQMSSSFPLSRGTHQGCPISPMLYALAVEPLAIAIRAHPNIRGLRMGRMTEVISLYADNMLLYLEDAGPSLTAALHLIQHFGAFSGLQINWSKSQILPIDTTVPTDTQEALPLVRTNQIKYLGVQCSRSLVDYM